MNKVKSTG